MSVFNKIKMEAKAASFATLGTIVAPLLVKWAELHDKAIESYKKEEQKKEEQKKEEQKRQEEAAKDRGI